MKLEFSKGETSVIQTVFIQDSSASTGVGLGSLDQTSSITGGYMKRNGLGIALAVDENVTTEGTYEAPTTAAQVRIGTPANMISGTYELHFHNDLFTTADWVTVTLAGATNMAPLTLEIQLTTTDPNNADFGLLLDNTNLTHVDANEKIALLASTQTTIDDIPTTAEFNARSLPSGTGSAYFDPATDAVADVTLVATLTTYTGNTLQTADVASLITTVGVAGAGLGDLGGMSTAMLAEVEAEVNDALVVLQLDHLLHVADAATTTTNSIIAKMAASDGVFSGFSSATDSLEAIRDQGDSAWITAVGFSTHDAAAVWAVGTRILTAANNITTDASAIGVTSGVVDIVSTVTGNVDGSVGSVAGNVDGTVASVVTKTGYSVSATGLDLVLEASDFVQAVASGVWNTVITGATFNITNSAGKRLRGVSGSILADGTAQSGGNNSIQLASGDVTIDNQFQRSKVVITAGTGAGQEAIISSSVASTDTLTTTPAWLVNPDVTSEYQIVPAQVHTSTQNGGYDDASVWVDTVGGAAGTELYVNGTSTNPVSNIADARTLADALNLRVFHLEPGSSVTLAQTFSSFEFTGAGYTVNLGSQDVSGCRFLNGNLTGTGVGSGRFVARDCILTGTLTANLSTYLGCQLAGDFVLGVLGKYVFDSCFSGAKQGTTTSMDFGAAIGSNDVVCRHWDGNLELKNVGVTGTDTMCLQGNGSITLNANCTGGTVEVAGIFGRTDNSGGAVTIIETARIDLPAINAEADAALSDYDGPTNTEMIARTLPTATYFAPATDTVANVTTVGSVTTKTGYSLVSTGLDLVLVDGRTLPNALEITAAVVAGKISGAGLGTEVFVGLDGATTRATVTVDGSGNRSGVVYV